MTLLTIAQSLKTNILTNLQALVDAGALGSYMAIDRGKDLAQIDPPGPYPFAVVAPPSITADFEDTDNNWREYRFDIMIVQKYENLQSNTDIEGLMDAVLNQFDDNFTLEGTAEKAVLPAEIVAAPVSTGDLSFICLFVTLKARALYTLSSV